MKNAICLLTIAIIAVSCFSEKLNNASRSVGAIWNAESTSVGYSTLHDTNGAEKKSLELTLENLKEIPLEYDHASVTNISAMHLFQNIEPTDYEGCFQITVFVNNFGDKYQGSNSIASLQKVQKRIKIIEGFFDFQAKGELFGFQSTLHSGFISNKSATDLFNHLSRIEDEYGKYAHTTINNFSFNYDNQSLTTYFLVYYGKVPISMEVTFGLEDEKITGLTIE